MRTLYLQCNMGVAGDMLAAALLELLPNPEMFFSEMEKFQLPGVTISQETMKKCGIYGTHLSVNVYGNKEGDGERSHCHSMTSFAEIQKLLEDSPLPDSVQKNAYAVYRLIAEAESQVHGVTIDQVHFHELGMLDAVVDIVSVCLLLNLLSPEQIIVSPVNIGSGQVRCQHGVLPVPTPAAVLLLEGIPIYSNEIEGELCTPTGAALLRHFATGFGAMPVMSVKKIGYGMGKKEFSQANCVRAFFGDTEDSQESILELRCNLDDMTPESIGFAVEHLLQEGALDVFATPIHMKKNRPAVLLTCLCRKEQREKFLSLLFLHTTTLGIRETLCNRVILHRAEETLETSYGPVRIKKSTGWGVCRSKLEYEDLAEIARQKNLPIDTIRREIEEKFGTELPMELQEALWNKS